jgi:hypothetical protein
MKTDERYLPPKLLKYISSIVIAILTVLLFRFGAYAISFTAVPLYPNEDTQVKLQWSAAASANYYKIFRNSGGQDIEVATVNVNGDYVYNTYTDTGLSPSTAYHYTIRGYSDAGMTNEIPLTGNAADVTTANIIRPYNISSKYDVNTKMVTLTWNGSFAAIDSIVSDGSGNTHTAHLANSITFYENSAAPVIYTISSKGLNLSQSGPSAPITVTPILPPEISAVASNGYSIISWTAFPQINDFYLERSSWTGNGWSSWEIALNTLSGTSVIDRPANGGSYRYRLTAKSTGGYSGSSNISDSLAIPKAPSGLTCTLEQPGAVRLSWTVDPGNEAHLHILRKQDNGEYISVAVMDCTATSLLDMVNTANGITYTYMISAYDNPDNASNSNPASVTFVVPAAPTGLTLTVSTSSAITLDWTDTNSVELGYIIERSDNSGGFERLATTAANTTTYTDTELSGGHLYTYRVKAFNNLSDSAYSNQVSINMTEITIPNSLKLTVVSSSQIDLEWTYPGSGVYYTAIERKIGLTGSWTRINVTAPGVLRYSNIGLSSNTLYFYRVRNYLSSSIMTVPYPNNDTGIGAYTKLGGLSLSGAAASENTIYLSWSGVGSGDSIIVERKMASGNFAVLATLNYTNTGWYDSTGLVPGAVYTYRIKTKNSSNESAYSNEAVVTNIYLNAPSSLTASANSEAGIELTWKDNSTDETGFEIWRRVYGANSYTLYDNVDRNTVKYTDKGARTGVQYYYMVRAYIMDSGIYSGYSNTASVGTGIIGAPIDLKFKYVSNTEGILTWTDTSTNETGFKVERKIGEEGDWTVIVWLSANTTSYTAAGLNQYNTYYFRVRAYNNTGNFDSLSSELEVSTAVPYAPTGVTAEAVSSNQINVKWKDNSENETGFRIMRKSAGSGYYTIAGEVGQGVTYFSDKNLYPGVAYTYKVVAFNGSGSNESLEAAAVTTGVKVTFTDLNGVPWARDSIENLAGRGIVSGKVGTRFMPGDTVTRAEFTSMMMKAFKLQTTPVGSLADVKVGNWFYKDVMTAEYYGIITGDERGRFYPDKAITREEIALIIFKTLEVAGKPLNGHDNSVLEKFRDKDQISPYAVSSMASLVGEGIMSGVSDTAIGPGNSATRAEAAVYIYKVIDR